ncbi:hypothetical protein [Psychrobacillus sp. FSL K6-1464]|uniref:hypothetical protein n=1 Tax=Psychrobacillus sp. FSL K6-1464 TaxID=2921545 RepID=UPI0030F683B0
MRKKYRKLVITVVLAFGLFINFSSDIQAEFNTPSIPQGASLNSDPIIGDH